MPQYALLVYVPAEGGPPADERQLRRWFDYTQALREADALVADDALEMTHSSTTVRVRGGETLVSQGPFAETEEVLGGYYVIDVPDIDAAVEWAARIPSAPSGSVEVRPIMVLPEEAACA